MEKTLEKIHAFNRFGSKLGLERMRKLMELLGNPQEQLKVIHVAGTNGKGSVCKYVYSVLQENGYQTGLFISPYLERFSERIEFNKQEISDVDLGEITETVLEKVSQMLEEGFESPTEFEVVTAIAFVYFFIKKAEYVVLEVGLGGRGDSTNVINQPLISVIVSISYDHTEYLGQTIQSITAEKAGIIKENGVVVSCVAQDCAIDILKDVCMGKEAVLHDVSMMSGLPVNVKSSEMTGSTFDVTFGEKTYEDIEISMMGIHQVSNAVCSLKVIDLLRNQFGCVMSDEKIKLGMKTAKQNGRIEIFCNDPMIIIDGAHNLDSAKALFETTRQWLSQKKILLVSGILKDKDVMGITGYLSKMATDIVSTQPDNPRALSAQALGESFAKEGKQSKVMEHWEDAISYALSIKDQYDGIIVTGSLYLVGPVRAYLSDKMKGMR